MLYCGNKAIFKGKFAFVLLINLFMYVHRTTSNGMDKIVIWLINAYQKMPLRSHYSCVFLPTCSEYTKQAVQKYGVLGGLGRGFIRICRCHPWQKNHYDPLK